jgi:predicted nuclease with TOPRIM domain
MSNFRIIGDEIEYECRPFARIVAPDFSIFRFDAIEEIEECDPAKAEAENAEWRREFEAEQAKEIEALQSRIETLETENEKWLAELNSLDDAGGVAQRIADLQAEVESWRKIAVDNRNAYHEAIKPKRRTPRKGA